MASHVPRHLASRRRGFPSLATTVAELAAGLALLAAAAVAGALFVRRPWENRLDVFAYSVVPARLTWRGYLDVADLGSTAVFLAGTGLCAAVAMWRDRARALACLVGPLCAVLVTEHVAKPLVARHGVLGGDSYPSGTVTAVAALAAALLLVSPRLLKPLSALAGALAVLAVSVAVIGLRWHFATDAVGGALVGAGAVFTVDALAHLPLVAWRELGASRRAGGGGSEPPSRRAPVGSAVL
jgi:membrane-associated phospholipid phosphatase